MNIYETLEYGIILLKEKNINEPIVKCRILLANLLNKNKEYLITHENEILNKNVVSKYKELVEKISKGIPIQYLINKQEFMGTDFFVNENVLIPQPDTEILVEEVINICNNKNDNTNILDLCTGSGAIGISILENTLNTNITLSDISRKALDVANINIKNIGLKRDKIKTIQSDLFSNIKDKYDIIVSNPPYIKTSIIKNLEKEVQNEPKIALDGGEDGLRFYRQIINEAYNHLNKNGYLCLEIGYNQKEEVIDLIEQSKNYDNIYSKKDLANNDRVIICQKRL